MHRCSVTGCNSSSDKPKIRFFAFPSNKDRCQTWLNFCKNPTLDSMFKRGVVMPSSRRRICSLHFRPEDFQNYLKLKLLAGKTPTLHGPEEWENVENVKRPTNTAQLLSHPVHNFQSVGNEDNTEMFFEPDTSNDNSYDSEPPSNLNDISPTRIPPEKDERFIKCSFNPYHMIEETPELYSFITLPYLNEEQFNLQWVYNIIDGTGGRDRVVYESTCRDDKDGFVLIKDFMWDGITLENLQLLAIPHRPGILSLRDLRVNHLPLLRNILITGKKAVMKKYGYLGSQLLVYLQYQPSFYHLHVHFEFISHLGDHFAKGHLLSSVIDNIEKYPNYYQDATLPFFLQQSDALFQKYEVHGIVRKLEQ